MENTLKRMILAECNKIIKRHNANMQRNNQKVKIFEKKTGKTGIGKPQKTPKHWAVNKLFNPFYVKKNVHFLSKVLAYKIRNQEYHPNPSLIKQIPKPSGGYRNITIFTIPDAAIAKFLYQTLLIRNFHTFSAYAYAYRYDRNAHNAIEHLHKSIINKPRVYILEYDFSKYFDTISHDYIIKILKEHLKISAREIYLIKTFLTYRKALNLADYASDIFTVNAIGIPQGNSISLLLANIACHELDKKIERTGAAFARFSDDSVIICDDYTTANICANLMISHGQNSGTKINFLKSDGISLLTDAPIVEMRSKTSFDFLGHKISSNFISIKDRNVEKIKAKLSEIIHRYLIYYPMKHSTINSNRYNARRNVDWDLVSCINAIRRYIYGFGLSENKMNKSLSNKDEMLVFTRCMLSFYPLVNTPTLFKDLDGWLVNNLYQALCKRRFLLASQFPSYTIPSKELLISGDWFKVKKVRKRLWGSYKKRKTYFSPLDTRLPSFYKSWRYNQKLIKIYGLQEFPNPEYY